MNYRTNKSFAFSNLRSSLISRLFLIFLFLSAGTNQILAEGWSIDSLRTVLSSSTSDANRIKLMSELSNGLKDVNLKESISFAHQALHLSRKIGDQEEEAKALFNTGLLIYDTQDKDGALAYFQRGEQICDQLGLKKLQADFLMKIAKCYRYLIIDSTQTVQHLLKSVNVSKAANYHYGTGRSYAKLASFYTKYNQIYLCEKYLNLSAEYYLKIKNGGEEVAHYYDEVGNKIWKSNPKKSMDFFLKGTEYSKNYPNIKVSLAKAYSKIGDHERALEYLQPAIVELRKMEYTRMLGVAIGLLAEVYLGLGDYHAASKTCDEGIALLTPLGRSNQKPLPAMYRAKGLALQLAGNTNAALDYYKKSLEEGGKLKDKFDLVKTNLVLGEFYATSTPAKGKTYCESSLKDAKKYRFVNLEIKACDCLFKIYSEEKAYEDALFYYKQKINLGDSMSALRVKYALDITSKISQKDQQIAQQAFERDIQDGQLRNQFRLSCILFAFSILGLILVVILSNSRRKIKKQNREIIEKTKQLENANQRLGRSNQELESYAYIASHDLKSPLKNIINFTQLLKRALAQNENPLVKDSLSFIEKSGKRMHHLIEDILEYSKFSNAALIDNPQEVINLNEQVTEISSLILNNAEGKSINIQASNLPSLNWNQSKIFLLLKNLIENGLKYNNNDQPTIKVFSKIINDKHSIFVKDNGIGIKEEFFDKIFVMFKRLHTHEKYEGTGLGLATCKKIVDEFNGEIKVSSEEGFGTTFEIVFPSNIIHTPAKIKEAVLV